MPTTQDTATQPVNRPNSPTIIVAIVAIIAAAIILGILYYLYAQNKATTNTPTTTPTPTMEMSTSPSTVAGSPLATQTANSTAVTVQNFAFTPSSITVKVGESVTWTNKDGAAHQVAFSDGTQGNIMNTNGTYTRTFTKAGSYPYHCAIHPSMTGTVVVQ